MALLKNTLYAIQIIAVNPIAGLANLIKGVVHGGGLSNIRLIEIKIINL